MSFVNATYVSVWDGCTEIRTHCEIDVNQEIPVVQNIEGFDVDHLDTCDEEYVELNGEKILTFHNLDSDVFVEDGQTVFPSDIDSDSKLYRIITDKAD